MFYGDKLSAETSVDTAQHAGTNPAYTSAWSRWAIEHTPEMQVMYEAGILGPQNREWRNIAEHCLVVNGAAMLIARQLEQSGVDIDIETVDKASILHDSTKRLEQENGITYANEHDSALRRQFLAMYGYGDAVVEATEYTGRVAEMFIAEPKAQEAAIAAVPIENLVVAYADARVRNTQIVPLDIARDMNKLKIPADSGVYDKWFNFYGKVGERIYGAIEQATLGPQALHNQAVLDLVETNYLESRG